MDCGVEQSSDNGDERRREEVDVRLGLAIKEVRNLMFEFHSGGGSLGRNCAVRFSISSLDLFECE